jgi:hypothetical protein
MNELRTSDQQPLSSVVVLSVCLSRHDPRPALTRIVRRMRRRTDTITMLFGNDLLSFLSTLPCDDTNSLFAC